MPGLLIAVQASLMLVLVRRGCFHPRRAMMIAPMAVKAKRAPATCDPRVFQGS